MARLNVPPTKSTGLRIDNELQFAREGHDLLEQKRQILVLELARYVEAAKREQQEVDDLLAEAHAAVREAAARVGSQKLARDAISVPVTTRLSVSEHRVMGISVPEIHAEPAAVEATFGFAGGTVKADDVRAAFSRALEAISRLAQTQNAVFRLARELRKTQRRVNALDKIFIPDYEETLAFIESTLEERERESFVIMRIVRDRLRGGSEEG
ncbi:MAG: V-type ATP synthase subunit D [Planctomycetota bacterium]